jgi:hypothetical protein
MKAHLPEIAEMRALIRKMVKRTPSKSRPRGAPPVGVRASRLNFFARVSALSPELIAAFARDQA